MFRFWSSEHRGCDTHKTQPHTDLVGSPRHADDRADASSTSTTAAVAAAHKMAVAPKRKRDDGVEPLPSPTMELDPAAGALHTAKRMRTDSAGSTWSHTGFCTSPPTPPASDAPVPMPASASTPSSTQVDASTPDLDEVMDTVQFQFSHEILLKHNELRLIEQEMAKCQIALEQLRRCHLIPYPTACPTPEQMLDIASGRGVVVRPRPGAAVPKWSSPFGVVDGPYARHYAKWLIPDPVFDGPLPNWPGLAPMTARAKHALSAEARATRNSAPDMFKKGRPTRTTAGQKPAALASDAPPSKDDRGPCVVRRADGQLVFLKCIVCLRTNFSSTQGFINHVRIAHKREFKSHAEAAQICGQPCPANGSGSGASQAPAAAPAAAAAVDKNAGAAQHHEAPSVAPSSASVVAEAAAAAAVFAPMSTTASHPPADTYAPGQVHPLIRGDGDAGALLERLEASNRRQCRAAVGKRAAATPSSARNSQTPSATESFVGSSATPSLSRFLEGKNFAGNLATAVDDAKVHTDFDEVSWCEDDISEDGCDVDMPSVATLPPPGSSSSGAAKRAPARQAPAQSYASGFDGVAERSSAADARMASFGVARVATSPTSASREDTALYGVGVGDGDEMDMDLSPNPLTCHAPSLVSDDGEYDDSDDGSVSEAMDSDLGAGPDLPEINTDEDEDQTHTTPRPLRHHRGSVKKDDAKHVSFVNPVKGSNKERRN